VENVKGVWPSRVGPDRQPEGLGQCERMAVDQVVPLALEARVRRLSDLGFGRIVVSEIELLNILANMV
jgi:hypothetical protein